MTRRPSALIADDEPLLRASLARQLAEAWADLEVVGEARNGREAVEGFERLRPDICFLDVRMPGMSGIGAAQRIADGAHLVFVTAFDHYAVQAFAQGALDYLLKPLEQARLGGTVARLRRRLLSDQPASNTQALLEQLTVQLQRATPSPSQPLYWIRAQAGQILRLIALDEVDYFRSEVKYTTAAWREGGGRPAEALIRRPLKALVGQLDPARFAQIHRSFVVNLRSIDHVRRSDPDTAEVHLSRRKEVLPVSRTYLHLF